MLSLRRPNEAALRALIERRGAGPHSYAEVGATRGLSPPGYTIDRNRVKLGEGEAVFERAVAAVRRWEMFRLGWVEMGDGTGKDAPITVGTTVSVLVHVLGFWSINLCRIVYVVDEELAPVRRFGFAYGTLAEHGERGEERFTVEHNEEDDSVHYDILAFSQPNELLARLFYPYTRHLQRRFAVDSMKAMVLACSGNGSGSGSGNGSGSGGASRAV